MIPGKKTVTRPISCLIRLLFGLFMIITTATNSYAETKNVVAMGVAVIQGENITGAQEKAVQDALRQALEQGVGMLMDATTVLQDDDLMEKIYSNSQGYISEYEIIKKSKNNGLYRTTIQALVNTGALKDELLKLGLIKAMMDYPRVLVLPYPQQNITPATLMAETVLIKKFTDKRFELVDPSKSAQLHDEAKELFKIDIIENVAARIGLKHHAEIVVLYGLEQGNAEFDGLMESTPISLRTQAIATTTAQILTAQKEIISGVGKTPDLARKDGARRVAENVVQPIMNTIVSWWADYTANGLPYIVTLRTSAKADMQVIAFQESVEAIPGVVSLTERSSGGGLAEMMVKYKGSTTDLKRAILKSLNKQRGFQSLTVAVSKGRFLIFSVL